jgi:hypothetical protein
MIAQTWVARFAARPMQISLVAGHPRHIELACVTQHALSATQSASEKLLARDKPMASGQGDNNNHTTATIRAWRHDRESQERSSRTSTLHLRFIGLNSSEKTQLVSPGRLT